MDRFKTQRFTVTVIDRFYFILTVQVLCVTCLLPERLVCRRGPFNTTGSYANTEYDVIKLKSCSNQDLPEHGCNSVPVDPDHVVQNGTGYTFGVSWIPNYKDDSSTLKGFLAKIQVEPADSTPFPWECFNINITRVKNSLPAMGTFYIECHFRRESHVVVEILSYPTKPTCHPGDGASVDNTIGFYLSFITDHTTRTTSPHSVTYKRTLPPTTNVVLVTALTCALVFTVLIVVLICKFKGLCKAPRCIPRYPRQSTVCPSTDVNSGNASSDGNGRLSQTDLGNEMLSQTDLETWWDFTKKLNLDYDD